MQAGQELRPQLKNVRAHRADHKLPNLREARAVHVGRQQEERQDRVDEERRLDHGRGGGSAPTNGKKPILDAEARRVKRARVAQQGVRQHADARGMHGDAQHVSAERVHERRPVEDVREVRKG